MLFFEAPRVPQQYVLFKLLAKPEIALEPDSGTRENGALRLRRCQDLVTPPLDEVRMRLKRAAAILAPVLVLTAAIAGLRGEGETIQTRLRRHVISMPADSVTGRQAFTEADSLAREYIRDRFAECGLKAALPGGDFLQAVPRLWKFLTAPSNTIVVKGGEAPWSLRCPDDYVVHPSCGSGAVAGKVAFIGYGIRSPGNGYDDFARIDLADKVVICYHVSPTHIDKNIRKMGWRLRYLEKVALIDSLGGRAVVFVRPASYTKTCNKLTDYAGSTQAPEVKQQAIPVISITHDALGRMMTGAGVDISSIEKELESATTSRAFVVPGIEVSLDIKIERVYRDAYNVLGLLEGKDTTQTIVVGAHYDGPNAEDNASGVADVLELARLCVEKGNYDCNLLFAAFGLEESGMVGSSFLVRNMPARVGAVKAMVNFDMVGNFRSDTIGVGRTVPVTEWRTIEAKTASAGVIVRAEQFAIMTDTHGFFRAGIPTFNFYDGRADDFRHRPDADSINRIDWKGMELALRYGFALVNAISSREIVLTSVGQDSLGIPRGYKRLRPESEKPSPRDSM